MGWKVWGAGLGGVCLALLLWAAWRDSAAEAVPRPPERISTEEAEAQLSARQGFTPVDRREPPIEPTADATGTEPGLPRAAEGLNLSARLLDEQALPLAGGRLARLVFEDEVPVEKEAARSERSGAVWLEIPASDLPAEGPLSIVASGPGRIRKLLTLERGLWAGVPVLSLNEILLEPGGAVSGRVVDSLGQPIEGAFVGLGPELGDLSGELEAMARLWPFLRDLGVGAAPPIARTEALGRFTLEGVPTGRFMVVACPWPSGAPLLLDRISGVRVLPGEETVVRDLVLREPGPEVLIPGRVEAPDGAPVGGAAVRLLDPAGSRVFSNTRSSEAGRFTLLAPAEGEFRLSAKDPEGRWFDVELAGVRPGGAGVVLAFAEEAPSAAESRAMDPDPARSAGGAATDPGQAPAEEGPRNPASLHGRFTLGGQSPGSWSVGRLVGMKGVRLDHDGEFVLKTRSAGPLRFFLAGPQGGLVSTVVSVELQLQPGPNEWSLDLPVGELVLENLPLAEALPDGAEIDLPEYVLSMDGEGVQYWLYLQERGGARLELSEVPAGHLVLRWRGPGARPSGTHEWPVAVEGDLQPGERATWTLP